MADTSERDELTWVSFTLIPLGNTVKLILKHHHLLPSDIVEDQDTFEGFHNGWPAILSNLKTYLETGNTLPAISI